MDPSGFENPLRHQELLEALAGQVHRDLTRQYPEELWRIRRAGIPFGGLTESQKALVLAAARENLEALLGAGVRLEPPHSPQSDLAEFRFQVERLLQKGEPILAYDLVRRALSDHPLDVTLRQYQALALIRTGAPEEARQVLTRLLEEQHRDQATLASLARAHQDLAERAEDPARRCEHRTRAYELYEEAYRTNRGVWSGIHAARLALELGFPEAAVSIATAVELSARQMLEGDRRQAVDEFWMTAIQGLASLLQRRYGEGFGHLEALPDLGRGRSGDLAEVRHLARAILRLLGDDATSLELILPSPRVVVFTGHMIDFPDRPRPRFPLELVDAVARILQGRVTEGRVEAGFASAACGAPLLFHEALQRVGAESHVLLPYGREEFKADSVAIRPEGDWCERYERVLAGATRVVVASPQRMDEGSLVFGYANLLLLGLGAIRARQLHCRLVPLVLWDGRPSAASGSVGVAVEQWRKLGHEPEIVNLMALQGGILESRPPRRKARAAAPLPGGLATRLMVMLFADVVHFSQLQERQVPRFVAAFLGAVGELERELGVRPTMRNTWGDGLFLVFRDPAVAVVYARALVRKVGCTDWAAQGLPQDLNLRVALHAGPVYVGRDPVTGRRTCYGSHVNSAARIEPITPPGKVYVSEAFAALAAALNIRGCACEYVGQTPLAKNYGVFPMYVLQTEECASGPASQL